MLKNKGFLTIEISNLLKYLALNKHAQKRSNLLKSLFLQAGKKVSTVFSTAFTHFLWIVFAKTCTRDYMGVIVCVAIAFMSSEISFCGQLTLKI
jgi:hypothetical protein